MSPRLYILGLVIASTILSCSGFLLSTECFGHNLWSFTRRDKCYSLRASKSFDISPELVKKTAALAQVQVTDEEVGVLVPRMEDFLGFVATMEEVAESSCDTFDTLKCGNNFLREDSAEKFSNVASVMENMPVEERSFLRVPKVGEDEG